MHAEQLIALEGALAELGTLYTVARTFAALQERAEATLLPRIVALGSKLRSLVRAGHLSEDALGAAAQEIVAVASEWRSELEQVHSSAVYQQALRAFAEDCQRELAQLIPRIFAGVRLISSAPALYFPISPSSGRCQPGSSPFLSPSKCADKIAAALSEGLGPEEGGTEWWERELPFIGCADTAATLETPIALRLAEADVRVSAFASSDDAGYRIYTARLRVPMSIVLAAEATDEWWQAYEESYRAFRDALRRELQSRGYEVTG
jgi:hypothetical protein